MNIRMGAIVSIVILSAVNIAGAQTTARSFECKVTDSKGNIVPDRQDSGMFSFSADFFEIDAADDESAALKAIAKANAKQANSAVAACCKAKSQLSPKAALTPLPASTVTRLLAGCQSIASHSTQPTG